MGILGLLLITVAKLLKMLLDLYFLIVLAAVAMSWFRPPPHHPVVRAITNLTEPVFNFIRRRLPRSAFQTGLDLAPIVVFLTLIFIETFVIGALYDIGAGLRTRSFEPRPSPAAPATLDLPEV